MKKKVEKFCRINDEKLEKDIRELQEYVTILEENLKVVKDPLKYKKMKRLDRDARLMIHDLKQMKLLKKNEPITASAVFLISTAGINLRNIFYFAKRCAIILNMKTLLFVGLSDRRVRNGALCRSSCCCIITSGKSGHW